MSTPAPSLAVQLVLQALKHPDPQEWGPRAFHDWLWHLDAQSWETLGEGLFWKPWEGTDNGPALGTPDRLALLGFERVPRAWEPWLLQNEEGGLEPTPQGRTLKLDALTRRMREWVQATVEEAPSQWMAQRQALAGPTNGKWSVGDILKAMGWPAENVEAQVHEYTQRHATRRVMRPH